MADEVKSGYVHKCGKSVKSWKRRWFVLKQNGYLYYYTDSSAKVEKGKIDVVDASDITPYSDKTKGAERPPSNLSTANAFTIITKERVYTCVCETLDEFRSWVSALEKIRGVVSADQNYPPPTYPGQSQGEAHPTATPTQPPPYTPQPQAPYPAQRGPPMPTYNTAPPPQPQPQPRPPAGPGYAGVQSYPPGAYQQPPPPRGPPVQQYYSQAPPPPRPPMPQYQHQPPPRPQYAAAGYPPQRPWPTPYPTQQTYPPRPVPPPAAYYPTQQQYRAPPPMQQPVRRQHTTTTVTVVSVPPPQQRVIIRR